MMNKQTLLSIGRKLLIIALLAGAVFLFRETGYSAAVQKKLLPASAESTVQGTGAEQGSTKPNGTAQPMAAVVCLPEGGRFGAAYHAETVNAMFYRFSAELGEALGSAGTPTEMTETDFYEACLGGCGVYLRFFCPQPLTLLAAWLGTEISSPAENDQAELLFLRMAESDVELCYRNEAGTYYRCTTAVGTEGLRSRMAEYSPNGISFAFENRLFSGSDGCMPVMEEMEERPTLKVSVPLPAGEELNALLQAMGMNSFVASDYSEADGTVVFVDEESTLRLSPTGSMYYRRSVLPARSEPQTLTDAVSIAWQVAEGSIGKSCGDAVLIFSGLEYTEAQNTVTVLLDYAVEGIPVRLAEGHAAEIVLRGKEIVSARLMFRRCALTEETALLLPFLQANAIAAAENATAELVYAGGGETMSCVWVKADG